MKTAVVFLLSACLLAASTGPLAVFHWLAKEAALTRKKGYGFPTHHTLSRFTCFDKLCLNKKEWKNRPQQRKFKGYKNDRSMKKKEKKPDFSNQ